MTIRIKIYIYKCLTKEKTGNITINFILFLLLHKLYSKCYENMINENK